MDRFVRLLGQCTSTYLRVHTSVLKHLVSVMTLTTDGPSRMWGTGAARDFVDQNIGPRQLGVQNSTRSRVLYLRVLCTVLECECEWSDWVLRP